MDGSEIFSDNTNESDTTSRCYTLSKHLQTAPPLKFSQKKLFFSCSASGLRQCNQLQWAGSGATFSWGFVPPPWASG